MCFDGLAWPSNWTTAWWLVNSLKWLAFQWHVERVTGEVGAFLEAGHSSAR